MRFGVDEAGKGPVLGSMFTACVRAPETALPDGVADSKRLDAGRRERLDAAMRDDERVGVGVAETPVCRIDGPDDMNTLTVLGHAGAIDAVAVDGDGGLCDAGDTSEARFARRVAGACTRAVTVDAEHGADDADPHVAAASIVAKVARDAHAEALTDRYGDGYGAVGSGYPSDQRTREFLRAYVDDNGELPACARASWATCDDVLAAAEQSELDQF